MLCSGSDSPCPEEPWCSAGSVLVVFLVPEVLKIFARTVIGVFLDPFQGKRRSLGASNSLE